MQYGKDGVCRGGLAKFENRTLITHYELYASTSLELDARLTLSEKAWTSVDLKYHVCFFLPLFGW